MTYYRGSYVTRVLDCLRKALRSASPETTSECVDIIISAANRRSHDGYSLVGPTTIHAYRRLHEIIASSLDRCVTMSGDISHDINHLLLSLARAKVMVKYQESRGQISSSIANFLMTLIEGIESKVKKDRRKDVIKRLCSQGRLLLDSMAVLVYNFGRKR